MMVSFSPSGPIRSRYWASSASAVVSGVHQRATCGSPSQVAILGTSSSVIGRMLIAIGSSYPVANWSATGGRRRGSMGQLIEVTDTRLWVDERGDANAFPLLVFHGGPGMDHTMFADYLDPLAEDGQFRLLLVDERACGRSDRDANPRTWTLQQMSHDVSDLAAALGIRDRYATLGHSYGAFLVLQHAVDHPGEPRGTIVSSGIAAARWLAEVDRQLEVFEPVELREQVTSSWA